MKKKFIQNFYIFFLITFLIIFCYLIFDFQKTETVRAGNEHNVSGWAWSENIGWVSFNSTSGGGPVSYGVDIDSSGIFSGYAWSETIGWISFNTDDLIGCPEGICSARMNLDTKEISGWARAMAPAEQPLEKTGGWEGWIKLRGTNYGVSLNTSVYPYEFEGWAWGDDVMGWISFNCSNQDVCETSDYKATTSFDFNGAPTAVILCPVPPLTSCEVFYKEVLILQNNSFDMDGEGDIIKSEWYVKVQGASDDSYELKLSCVNKCDYTPQLDVTAGDWTAKLYVEDSGGLFDETTHNFKIKKDIEAGFMCSLDGGSDPNSWVACEDIEVEEGETIWLKDDILLSEHSSPSSGAVILSHTRVWENDIPEGGFIEQGVNMISIIVREGTVNYTLTVEDSMGRTDSITHSVFGSSTGLLNPQWIEVSPF